MGGKIRTAKKKKGGEGGRGNPKKGQRDVQTMNV